MAHKNMGDADLLTDARALSRNGSHTHYDRKRKALRRHHVLKVALVTVLAVVLAGVVAVAAYILNINSRLGGGIDSSLRNTLTTQEAGEPFYMLLLGIDKDEERSQSEDFGSSDSAYRSDSIMLVRIDPQKKKATLVSIPRDTMVDMGKYGTQKINAAYSLGGASYAVKMVEKISGVKISHYAEIDMNGMEDVVDAVGGVTVNLGVAVKDPHYTGLDLPAGKQTLDGKTAALLCRARHAYDSYGGGDFYRAANQRAVIMGVAKKVLSSNVLTMADTVSAMADMVNTDMSVNEIVSLANQFRGMDTSKDIMNGLAPTTSKYVNGISYEILDEDAWKTMMERVEKGLSPYSSADQDPTAGVAADTGDATSKKGAGASDDDGSSDDSSSSESPGDDGEATYSGSVRVLNASGVDGLAARRAKDLEEAGFTTTVASANMPFRKTVVVYNGEGARSSALGVVRELDLDVEPQENDGSYSTSADVILVLGSDQS